MAEAARLESLRRTLQVVYALQAVALLGGVLGSGTIAAQFAFVLPALAGLVVDAAVRSRSGRASARTRPDCASAA